MATKTSGALYDITGENITEVFGPATDVARKSVDAFCDALQSAQKRTPASAFQRWSVHFPKAGVDDFAMHTYFALVVKLVLAEVLAAARGQPSLANIIIQSTSGNRSRDVSRQIENGRMFRELGVVNFPGEQLFSWYTAAWSANIEHVVRRMADLLSSLPRINHDKPHNNLTRDLFRQLYHELFPRSLRHPLGEYYTPDWLVDHVLDQVGYRGEPDSRLLDPACGSGAFLIAAIQRAKNYSQCNDPCHAILDNIVGYDMNPAAVLSARANYLIALGDLPQSADSIEAPVYQCDSILDEPSAERHSDRPFDYLVGNPPWIAWDNLPAGYRRATGPLWEKYGLFSLSGNAGRHGGAKKDLAMLLIYACLDRYVKRGGRLGMVVPQTIFQTKGAGDGFRRFRLGADGDWLQVQRVDDMAALRPFIGVTNLTGAMVLEKGAPTQYPVSYVKWKKIIKGSELFSTRGHNKKTSPYFAEYSSDPFIAEPIDRARLSSPWFLRPEGLQTDLAALVGRSDYTAHLGANSGGANAVYWLTPIVRGDGGILVRSAVERKRQSTAEEHVIEPDLLYPLLRWGDVARYRALPSAAILLTQDVATRSGIEQSVMQRKYPRTHAYMKQYEQQLCSRAAWRRYQVGKPFYSMYNVGPYTVAPIKVVWRRMDRLIRAAVVEEADYPLLGRRTAIPQETCVLIAVDTADEAHYICAVLNSALVGFLVGAHSVGGGKGFGTPSILDYIKLKRYNPQERRHHELAGLGRSARAATAERAIAGNDAAAELDEIQHAIDRSVADLWGLSEKEGKEICKHYKDSGNTKKQ
jgi:hypothetical protein